MTTARTVTMDSPLGPLRLAASDDGLCLVAYDDPALGDEARLARHDIRLVPGTSPVTDQARRQLEAYFAGRGATFELPLAAAGTPFQQAVWRVTASLAPGQTMTYGQVAAAIGNRRASRAVGAALGANRLAIVVPCHRILGAGGSLTGYTGEAWRKTWLLQHEGVALAA